MMTSATRPENLMSVGADREQNEVGWRGRHDLAGALDDVLQTARSAATRSRPQAPRAGQSLAPCEPNRPRSMVAPVQASGRKVTATLVFSTRKAQRRANLIAVQRAFARRRHPAGAVAVPVGSARGRAARIGHRRPCRPYSPAGSAGNIRARGAEEAAEAEAIVGQHDRAVRISLAGGDRVARPAISRSRNLDFGRGRCRRCCRAW